mgnify:CR=1 FL=1
MNNEFKDQLIKNWERQVRSKNTLIAQLECKDTVRGCEILLRQVQIAEAQRQLFEDENTYHISNFNILANSRNYWQGEVHKFNKATVWARLRMALRGSIC